MKSFQKISFSAPRFDVLCNASWKIEQNRFWIVALNCKFMFSIIYFISWFERKDKLIVFMFHGIRNARYHGRVLWQRKGGKAERKCLTESVKGNKSKRLSQQQSHHHLKSYTSFSIFIFFWGGFRCWSPPMNFYGELQHVRHVKKTIKS